MYRPPSNSAGDNTSLIKYLLDFSLEYELLLLGDFNLPHILWTDDPPTAHASLDSSFLDLFVASGLLQWINFPTTIRSDNTIDLVLTSEDDRISFVSQLPPLPNCDHIPTVFSYVFPGHGLRQEDIYSTRNWFSGNYRSCNDYFDFHDWDLVLYGLNCVEANDILMPIVNKAIEAYIPLKRPTRGRPPWQRNIPTNLTTDVKNTWQSYKFLRSRNPRNSPIVKNALSAFKAANIALKHATITAVSKYELSLASDKRNPKRFHAYLRSKKVDRPSVGPLFVNGNWIGENEPMGHALGTAFSSVFNPVLPNAPLPHQTCSATMEFSPVLPSQVHSALLSLNNSTSCGPDGIPSIFLKKCASSLAYPLSIIYNKSFSTGLVPTQWKSAIILPLFKGGIRSDPLKYRPISLTPPACKTGERLALSQLNPYLEANQILSDLQFGFRSGVSVSDQLLYTYSYIVNHFDKGEIVDIMYFDSQKALTV